MRTSFLLIFLVLAGCGTYRHARPVVLHAVQDGGRTNYTVSLENTSISVFFQRLDATALKTLVQDGAYKRTVSMGQLGTAGDAEFMKALGDAVADGMAKYQSMGLKESPPPVVNPVPPQP